MTPTMLMLVLAAAGSPGGEAKPAPTLHVRADQARIIALPADGKPALKQRVAQTRGMAAVRVPESPPLVAERGPDGRLVIRHRPLGEADPNAGPVEGEPK